MAQMQIEVCLNDQNASGFHSTDRNVEAVAYVLSGSKCERNQVGQHTDCRDRLDLFGNNTVRNVQDWNNSSHLLNEIR